MYTMLDTICQIGILIFGSLGIWLINEKNLNLRKWGTVCGLLSQPFWIVSSLVNFKWGIFIICILYTISWSKGFYILFIKK